MSEPVRVFDTTLRDGEQSPGATMTESPSLIHSSASGKSSERAGKSAGMSLASRAVPQPTTKQRPSRAMCCSVPIQPSPLSHVGENRISTPSA